MAIQGKNITFYASAQTVKELDKLETGEKSGYINRAVQAYSRLEKLEREIELALTAATHAYVNTSGCTIEELIGTLAKRKRLAKTDSEYDSEEY